MKIVRSVVANCLWPAAMVAMVVGVGGCSAGERGDELVSSVEQEYADPVWIGDTVYYLAGWQGYDSDTPTELMRVRAGARPEAVQIDHPNCPAANEPGHGPGDPVPISDRELGLIISCGPDDIRLVRWAVGGGPSVTIAELDMAGGGVAWSQRSGVVYFSSHSCANGGLRAQLGRSGICLTDDPDQRFPVVADDGSIVYLTPQCGTDAPEPRFTFSVCRYDAHGETSTLARGLSAPGGMTVHGDRIVVVGEVGGQPGLWRVQRGQFQSFVAGHYQDAAFNADGTRLAIVYANSGLLSTRYSVRVIDAPRA
ncbi:hypothetical protein [Dactylosporangium sp. NPDC049140]|uniref:hypothetical protein n=1 Tax=Dactylosporangium sp. NPDC049140 TaxID=3155647 RepID=UPI003409EA44